MRNITDAMRALTAHHQPMPTHPLRLIARLLNRRRDRRLAREYDRQRGYDRPVWTRRRSHARRLSELTAADRARIADRDRMRAAIKVLTDGRRR